MSSRSEEAKGRRGFFLAMVAGLGDAVAEAASVIEPSDPTAPPAPTSDAESPEPRPLPPRRRGVPPSSIPGVRR